MPAKKKTSLEKAFESKSSAKSAEPEVSKEEEAGYHKGALNTLVNERNELLKLVQITEALMQAHMKRLEELGVKFPKK
jgi:hypothetical protein|tara:strand:- start:3384 stop:3617 length:234 start_codon:yes stop_codon:yes gene_type:complete